MKSYVRIKLNKNKWSAKEDSFTLVDIDDLEKLKPYTIHKVGGGYAAIAFENRTLPLHRFIMGLTNSPRSAGEVDHINENKLDNRKKNLEIISHRENIRRANKKREKIYR